MAKAFDFDEEKTPKVTKAKKKVVKKVVKKSETESSSSTEEDGEGPIEVMLAHNYDPDKHDPSGWLMSEKLDGVRCYWNGCKMYTRTGKLFYPSK